MPTPKGIRVRSTPDWFAQYICSGSLQVINGTANHFYYISLFNNSTRGDYLSVHWLMATAAVASAMLFYFLQEPFGAAQISCQRINPSLAGPPGVIYLQDNGTSPIANSYFMHQSTFTGGAIGGGAPLAVIPAGWSLVAGTPIADSAPGVTFQYIPFLDPKDYQPE